MELSRLHQVQLRACGIHLTPELPRVACGVSWDSRQASLETGEEVGKAADVQNPVKVDVST